ncbi:hypothetical protein PTTG_07552, partial [Puccinia triticina 1-1 BBBD Race 1]
IPPNSPSPPRPTVCTHKPAPQPATQQHTRFSFPRYHYRYRYCFQSTRRVAAARL